MVSGTIAHTSDTNATFYPNQKLKDGVYHVATVWGKTEADASGKSSWVKGPGGTDLKQGRIWAFWTMPDLTGKVTIVPVQSVENVNLILNKPTVLKTYIRWETKQDVASNRQVKSMDVDTITFSYPSGSAVWGGQLPARDVWVPYYGTRNARRKREYQNFTSADESYTKLEKFRTFDSVNYYGFTPTSTGSASFSAKVELKTPDGNNRTFTSDTVICDVIATKKFSYKYMPIKVGDWSATGITDATGNFVNIQEKATKNHQILSSLYPLSPANVTYKNQNLTNLDIVNVPGNFSYPSGGMLDKTKLLIVLTRIAEMSKLDAMVGVVPLTWLQAIGLTQTEFFLIGLDIARRSTLIAHGADSFVLSHEFGHMLRDWGHKEDEADEGFYVETREDKRTTVAKMSGRPPSSPILNIMVTDPVESAQTALWIDEDQFTELYNNELAAAPSRRGITALQSETSMLLASGLINTSTNDVTLDPWYIIEDTEWKQPSAGEYALEFYDQSNTKLSEYSFSGSQPIDNVVLFLMKVPYPADTNKILIKKGAIELKEILKSTNAPQVTISSPTQGSTLSGTKNITWTATDGDGDVLTYSVSCSADGGQTWVPLLTDGTDTSYSWNTDATISNGTDRIVRVLATDGLNTTSRTVGSLTISNAPYIVSSSPAPDEQDVPVGMPLTIVFSDDMDSESITVGSITLEDSGAAEVQGSLSYDSDLRQVLFIPAQSLRAETTYTVKVADAVQNTSAAPLSGTTSWSFTTEDDVYPPQVTMVTPQDGALDVPLNTIVAIIFDEGIDSSTITQDTFCVTNTSGTVQTGTTNYNESTKIASITFDANLGSDTTYTATLKAGVKDMAGNDTSGDYEWSFQTGSDTIDQIGFSGAYADQALDEKDDELYDTLLIDVGVIVLSNGTYNLNGRLVDMNGEEIDWATTGDVSLDGGVSIMTLSFQSNPIRSHGVDGPYTLRDVQFYNSYDTSLYAWKANAYNTRAYDVTQFSAVITLTGLPDINLSVDESRDNAFNLNEYAEHATLADDQLTYEIEVSTDPGCGVSIDSEDNIDVNPDSGWVGTSDVTVKVTGGTDIARDTFKITASEDETTTTSSTTTTTTAGCSISLLPNTAEVVSWQSLSFTIAPSGDCNYPPSNVWGVQSIIGSTIDLKSGIYVAGLNLDPFNRATDLVVVTDLANGSITAQAIVTVWDCLMLQIYGENSEEAELLRLFRDSVLATIPEGKELINLYYQWSPVIVQMMNGNEEFKKEVKEMIDGVLPLIREIVE